MKKLILFTFLLTTFSVSSQQILFEKLRCITVAVPNIVETIHATSVAIVPTANIKMNETKSLTAIFTPVNATIKSGTWTIDSNLYAIINSDTGSITGLSVGSSQVTFTADDETNGIISSTITIETVTPTIQTLKAFPDAYGAAALITGGRGQEVYHVTSLSDDGSVGTFRDAVRQGDRTIVFDVSGIIEITSNLYIGGSDNSPFRNLSILGQSAPEGGITIASTEGVNIGMEFRQMNNIIMRYIRIRSNFYDADRTVFRIRPNSAKNVNYGYDIILDHISLSYGGAQGFSVSGQDTHNITFQNGLIGESKTGALFGDTSALNTGWSYEGTFRNTLFYNVSHRTPNTAFNGVDVYNNVSYDWNNRMSVITNGAKVNHFNNYVYTGNKNTLSAGSVNGLPMWQVNAATDNNPAVPFLIWTKGNQIQDLYEFPDAEFGDVTNDPTEIIWINHSPSSLTVRLDPKYFTNTQFPMQGVVPETIMTALQASTVVPVNAGANKYLNADGSVGTYRDPQDTRYVANTLADTPEPWGCCQTETTVIGAGRGRHTASDQQPYFDHLASMTGIPINTRPGGFYGTNPHIPAAYLTANSLPNTSDIHNVRNSLGYTILEQYLNNVDEGFVVPPNIDITSITISPPSATITVGGSILNLDQTVLPTDASFPEGSWSSSNEAIATVDSTGNVTAVSEGIVNIVFTASDTSAGIFTGTSVITVTPYIETSPSFVSIRNGESTTTQGDAVVNVTGLTPTAGNLLIAVYGGNNGIVPTPVGFTPLGQVDSPTGSLTYDIFYKISNGTETNVLFDNPQSVTTIAHDFGHVLEYANVDQTTPIEQFSIDGQVKSTTNTIPSITSTGTNRLAVAMVIARGVHPNDGALVQDLVNYSLDTQAFDSSNTDSWDLFYSTEVLTPSTITSDTIIFPNQDPTTGIITFMLIPINK